MALEGQENAREGQENAPKIADFGPYETIVGAVKINADLPDFLAGPGEMLRAEKIFEIF